jgi:hypothetical protein
MIFLTGTLPPSIVSEFERTMLLYRARMICYFIARRDIYYGVSRCLSNQRLIRDLAISRIWKSINRLKAGARAIIYC